MLGKRALEQSATSAAMSVNLASPYLATKRPTSQYMQRIVAEEDPEPPARRPKC